MKKKIVSVVFVAAIAIAAGYTMKQNAEKNDFSDIELTNIEALARAELPDVEVVCSKSCTDGIGQCWYLWNNGCIRSISTNIYCTC